MSGAEIVALCASLFAAAERPERLHCQGAIARDPRRGMAAVNSCRKEAAKPGDGSGHRVATFKACVEREMRRSQ